MVPSVHKVVPHLYLVRKCLYISAQAYISTKPLLLQHCTLTNQFPIQQSQDTEITVISNTTTQHTTLTRETIPPRRVSDISERTSHQAYVLPELVHHSTNLLVPFLFFLDQPRSCDRISRRLQASYRPIDTPTQS